MVVVFALTLVVGVLALGWWLVVERTRGQQHNATAIRRIIVALVAFGIGGMSAAYAG